jgi:ribosomal protein S18 acetylase RimI-like enzyme
VTTIVRAAVPADYDDIRRIGVDAYVSGGFIAADGEYARVLAEVEQRAATHPVYVAVRDGVVAGSITLASGTGHLVEFASAAQVEMRMLTVDPAHQRAGIARALVAHSIETVAAEGFEAIVLRSATDLVPAHALYSSVGFERYPEQDIQLNEDTFQLAFIYRIPVHADRPRASAAQEVTA